MGIICKRGMKNKTEKEKPKDIKNVVKYKIIEFLKDNMFYKGILAQNFLIFTLNRIQ